MDGSGDSGNINQRPTVEPPMVFVDDHDMGDSVAALAEQLEGLAPDQDDYLGAIQGAKFSPASERFEMIIGAIEEIVVGDEFQSLQNHFLSTYWTKFSEKEEEDEGKETEEKLEHFKIFQAYSQDMAHLLENQLKKTFKNEPFDFSEFVQDFTKRVEECEKSEDREAVTLLESEIFEMLFTLTDFVKFKELFMDYKKMMEGKTPNLSTGITLKPVPASARR